MHVELAASHFWICHDTFWKLPAHDKMTLVILSPRIETNYSTRGPTLTMFSVI